jgi:hypothetical protein
MESIFEQSPTIAIFGTMACAFLGFLALGIIVGTIRYFITGKRYWHPYNE